MFVVGGVGLVHEVFFVQPPAERPFLIAACLALMGLPFVLQGDTILRGGKTPEQKAVEERQARDRERAELKARLDELGTNGGNGT